MTEHDRIVPLRFDLSALVRRSVATLYSHLVTRPTGQAVRLGIESQIGELNGVCVSILDFTDVLVLDYSCADEAVAKLIQRYQPRERVVQAYFIARGVGDRHREALEAVLARHRLALVAEIDELGFTLLGDASPLERAAWAALERRGEAAAAEIVSDVGDAAPDVHAALESLLERGLVTRRAAPPTLQALSSLI
ncbi:MAG: hypothetical protein HY703_11340 [Gemmatimonadetes bacterium]|nr:hypothetical protein [Gemmatimonadota bacterium]